MEAITFPYESKNLIAGMRYKFLRVQAPTMVLFYAALCVALYFIGGGGFLLLKLFCAATAATITYVWFISIPWRVYRNGKDRPGHGDMCVLRFGDHAVEIKTAISETRITWFKRVDITKQLILLSLNTTMFMVVPRNSFNDDHQCQRFVDFARGLCTGRPGDAPPPLPPVASGET